MTHKTRNICFSGEVLRRRSVSVSAVTYANSFFFIAAANCLAARNAPDEFGFGKPCDVVISQRALQTEKVLCVR